MELGARELLQFLLVVATIAGSFQVVRSQLTRVIQDLEKTIKEISTIHDRIDKVEANSAVGTAQELVHELAENLHGKFDNVPMSNDEVEHLEMKAELHYGI